MSDESIKLPTIPGNSLSLKLKGINDSKIAIEFKESCLKQKKATFTHRYVVNLFIVPIMYIAKRFKQLTLDNRLFEVAKLLGMLILINMDKAVMVLDLMDALKLVNSVNVVTFGVGNSLSVHADNRKSMFLVINQQMD